MEKLDALIKKLQEAKEELNKNMNCSYGSEANVSKEDMNKGSKDPKFVEKEVKIKNLKDQVAAGTYKPDAGKIADKMINPEKIKKEEEDLDKNNRNRGKQQEQQSRYTFNNLMERKRYSDEMERQTKANAVAPVKNIPAKDYKPQVKLIKEDLVCSENGQWQITEKK